MSRFFLNHFGTSTVSMFLGLYFLLPMAYALAPQSHPPLRVAIVGLVHGHVHGFLAQYQRSPEIEIVAVVEPDAQLRSAAATRYGFAPSRMFGDIEEMIAQAHPQAVFFF